MSITSVGYDGTINEVQFAKLAPLLGSDYSVGGPTDWKVEVVAGQDRTIRILPGSGYGQGVLDTADAQETLQLGAIASGSRWDLVVARRDWQPPGGTTAFAAVQGAAAQAIPAGRIVGPGVQDDQPIALVQVTAGQTLPTAVVDLRCWHGNGGVVAATTDALAYLTRLGSVIFVGAVAWIRLLDLTGNPVWSQLGSAPTWDEVTGKPTSFPTTWTAVAGKPSTFTPSGHAHSKTDVVGVQADIDWLNANKSAWNHGHDYRYYNQTVLRSDGSDRVHGNTPAGSGWFSVWVDGNHNFCHNTSSIRYKQDVRDHAIDPAAVLALRPRLYDRKGDDTPNDEYGLIAEEVLEHVPEIVTFWDGQVEAVRYDLLSVALLSVVQDQQAQLTSMAERLDRLEGAGQ